MNKGKQIYDWIKSKTDEGLTVYAQTYLKTIMIKSKHMDSVRVSGKHCEVRQGKSWVSINWCKITAQ